jgi:hypothetical protein
VATFGHQQREPDIGLGEMRDRRAAQLMSIHPPDAALNSSSARRYESRARPVYAGKDRLPPASAPVPAAGRPRTAGPASDPRSGAARVVRSLRRSASRHRAGTTGWLRASGSTPSTPATTRARPAREPPATPRTLPRACSCRHSTATRGLSSSAPFSRASPTYTSRCRTP